MIARDVVLASSARRDQAERSVANESWAAEEQAMECPSCRQTVKPGLEIALRPHDDNVWHCPYCLCQLPPPPDLAASSTTASGGTEGERSVSVKRYALRKQVRERFVDSLLARGLDGTFSCPLCDHRYNRHEAMILRNSEHFRCYQCCHDLTALAYAQEAYSEQRWLPVLYALAELQVDKKCQNCRYLGVVAKACSEAMSRMPSCQPKYAGMLNSLVRHSEWQQPGDDSCLGQCLVATQYRKLAGEGLTLL